MRQSIKHKLVTSPEQQLNGASYTEAIHQSASLQEAEVSGEFGSTQETLKSTPKKAVR